VGIYFREHDNGLIYGFWQPIDGGGSNQFGPFINRNHFGGWMLLALGVLVGSLIGRLESALREDGPGRRRRLEWLSSSSANGLLLTGAAVLVGVVSIFWALSRSSIVSLAALVAMFALRGWPRSAVVWVRRGAGWSSWRCSLPSSLAASGVDPTASSRGSTMSGICSAGSKRGGTPGTWCTPSPCSARA
jgi:hypothetical protein